MLQLSQTENIRIQGDILVTVPDSIQLMTPYILHEQKDWFEDEIKFIRKIITPGMKVIDIGANYGLYTLTLGAKVGANGKVWAFEPTSSVVACLRQSIALNNFSMIDLIHAGVSDHTGEAELEINSNAELNSMTPASERKNNAAYETIQLVTLDSFIENGAWDTIEFIKLDAEGQETNIIEGGKKALALLSPLIMYELKQGDVINMPLIQAFEKHEYKSYYLIPGLDLLAPFDPNKPFDSFQLNLFCCKKDKAAELEKKNLLVTSPLENSPPANAPADEKKQWQTYLSSCLFASSFNDQWDYYATVNSASPEWQTHSIALHYYSLAHSPLYKPAERLWFLNTAYTKLASLVKNHETFSRMMTLTRIAHESGQRHNAVMLLGAIINKLGGFLKTTNNEPFLPVLKRYEQLDPGKSIHEWIISSVLECYETLHAFSSYFTGQQTVKILQNLNTYGFQSEEMTRRLNLIQKRFGNTQHNESVSP